jgi:hypothetical protein
VKRNLLFLYFYFSISLTGADTERFIFLNSGILRSIQILTILRRDVMSKKVGALFVIMTTVIFLYQGVSHAAYFQGVGKTLHISDTLDLDMTEGCSDTDSSNGDTITIMPSPGEQVGDYVSVSYCWSATGSTHITGEGYTAIAGVGGNVSAASTCAPGSINYDCTGDAAVQLIHTGVPTSVISYPATVIQNGQTITQPRTCGTFQARIGDQLRGAGGVFAALAGPSNSAETYASLNFDVELSLPSTLVPTMNEWGMIIFSLLLAGSAVYMMRRRYSN